MSSWHDMFQGSKKKGVLQLEGVLQLGGIRYLPIEISLKYPQTRTVVRPIIFQTSRPINWLLTSLFPFMEIVKIGKYCYFILVILTTHQLILSIPGLYHIIMWNCGVIVHKFIFHFFHHLCIWKFAQMFANLNFHSWIRKNIWKYYQSTCGEYFCIWQVRCKKPYTFMRYAHGQIISFYTSILNTWTISHTQTQELANYLGKDAQLFCSYLSQLCMTERYVRWSLNLFEVG